MAFEENGKKEGIVEEVSSDETIEEEIVVEEETQPKENIATKTLKKDGNKKPSKIKGAFSELKKVTWPSFGSVVKKTAVVLSVTAIFLVVVIGIDQLLYLLYNLLTKNM